MTVAVRLQPLMSTTFTGLSGSSCRSLIRGLIPRHPVAMAEAWVLRARFLSLLHSLSQESVSSQKNSPLDHGMS